MYCPHIGQRARSVILPTQQSAMALEEEGVHLGNSVSVSELHHAIIMSSDKNSSQLVSPTEEDTVNEEDT